MANGTGAKVHGWAEDRFGRHVDIGLTNAQTTRDVFWSVGGNSYVLAENALDSQQPLLVSINGMGEVRWVVSPQQIARAVEQERTGTLRPYTDSAEYVAAARHFGLRRVPETVREEFTKLCREQFSERGDALAAEQITLYEQGVRDVRLHDISIYLIDQCRF